MPPVDGEDEPPAAEGEGIGALLLPEPLLLPGPLLLTGLVLLPRALLLPGELLLLAALLLLGPLLLPPLYCGLHFRPLPGFEAGEFAAAAGDPAAF